MRFEKLRKQIICLVFIGVQAIVARAWSGGVSSKIHAIAMCATRQVFRIQRNPATLNGEHT
jgi:hypothetical protein